MAVTPVLQTTYDNLRLMDQDIQNAEAHLRVLKNANFPGVVKLEGDLAKAKVSRNELMKAIEDEMNR